MPGERSWQQGTHHKRQQPEAGLAGGWPRAWWLCLLLREALLPCGTIGHMPDRAALRVACRACNVLHTRDTEGRSLHPIRACIPFLLKVNNTH